MDQFGLDLLLDQFPAVEKSLPRAAVENRCTPVHPLPHFARESNLELWVKRDDQTNPLYGGNKPRKLELLLGKVQQEGYQGVVTIGGWGTNHGLATAVLCRRLGFVCHLLLFRQPVTDHVKAHLALFSRHGAKLHHCEGIADGLYRTIQIKRMAASQGQSLLVIPPGGSTPLGAIGFCAAALELAEQVRSRQMPQPGVLFVPVGSGGTIAGLVAGFRIAKMPIQVVGVRVAARLMANRWWIAYLANAVVERLRRLGAAVRIEPVRAGEIQLLEGYMGPDYGMVTPKALWAMREMLAREGIQTEITYSAKCLAALKVYLAGQRKQDKPVLWWNTYAGDGLIAGLGKIDDLVMPKPFDDLLRNRVQ